MPIVFGPWLGEFGWELARWNPACRAIAKKFPRTKKYAIGPRGHGIIYEFVDEYIDFGKELKYISCMQNASCRKDYLQKYVDIARKLGTRIISPSMVGPNRKFEVAPRKFIGTKTEKIDSIIQGKRLICMFPRQRVHEPSRNWDVRKWVKLIEYYTNSNCHVMTFGGLEDNKIPYKHENYTDFIGYREVDELDIAITALNKSTVSIAVQSGGIYLSMYAANLTVSFGLKKHENRLKSEDLLKSNYRYIIIKDFSFNHNFVINTVAKFVKV